MDLIFLGPPGAGKGTQAKRACERLGVRHLSTGDLLRKAVGEGSALGDEAKGYMDRGALVPDELVGRMIEAELGSEACRAGFLLDGYPRNVAQAELLGNIEDKLGRSIERVVLLDVPDSLIEERLLGRRSCPNPSCGAMYHISFKPPKTEGVCDLCQTALIVRADDTEAVVRDRLKVFHDQTAPLLDYYGERKLLAKVDGTASLDDVHESVMKLLSDEGAG